MIPSLLSLDTNLLIWARGLLGPEYATLIQILGESVVVWGALVLIGFWMLGVSRKDNAYKIYALQIFFTIILTFFFYTLINFGIAPWRPNPQEVVGGIAPLIPHPLDNSFPSGHALFTAALIVGLLRFAPKKKIIFVSLIFGILTAIARVIGGVHYPGDILGGWLLGAFGGYICSIIIGISLFRRYIFAFFIWLAHFFRL